VKGNHHVYRIDVNQFKQVAEKVRDALAATALGGTRSLIYDAAAGRQDALEELRTRWDEDPNEIAAEIVNTLKADPALNVPATKLMRRAALAQLREAAAPQAPAKPDTRPMLRLSEDAPVKIQAITLKDLVPFGLRLRVIDITEEWDDPDNDDNIIMGHRTYAPGIRQCRQRGSARHAADLRHSRLPVRVRPHPRAPHHARID
jgi:hypothetical protein